jgi:NADH-quinone oxidoreductase subunit L
LLRFILAIGAGGAGYYGAVELKMLEEPFWRGAILVLSQNNTLEAAHHLPEWVGRLPLAAGLVGILVAYIFYLFKTAIPNRLAKLLPWLYKFLQNKWYFDELYEFTFVKPAKALGKYLWQEVDAKVIDGIANGTATMSSRFATMLSVMQSGFVYHYAFTMLLGLLILLSWVLFY